MLVKESPLRAIHTVVHTSCARMSGWRGTSQIWKPILYYHWPNCVPVCGIVSSTEKESLCIFSPRREEKIHFYNLIRGGWYHWPTTYCLPPIKQSFDMWFLKSFYPVIEVGITTTYFRLPHQSKCGKYNTNISIRRQTHKIDMSPR